MLTPGLLHCQGLLDGRTDALLAAADTCDQLRRPWQAARCHEDTGVLLTRRGHRDEARHELEPAAAGCQALNAAWNVARVDAGLRELGVRCGARGTRGRPIHGWQSPTNTALKVAGLVAEGLFNPNVAERLFISRRTVQIHVSSILAKLDLTSRVEVAIRMAQQDAR
ncbi:LuxR C-terminal-related transcriptional regulator [Streptomyces griseochromogenes]|uniref:LuxR C-terminal-related transcriptional regulator n=1 Tax=Streptomyces griseochromogenes TaxID=68214 RepID=UPI0037B0FC53